MRLSGAMKAVGNIGLVQGTSSLYQLVCIIQWEQGGIMLGLAQR